MEREGEGKTGERKKKGTKKKKGKKESKTTT